jgi:hypothetical protein
VQVRAHGYEHRQLAIAGRGKDEGQAPAQWLGQALQQPRARHQAPGTQRGMQFGGQQVEWFGLGHDPDHGNYENMPGTRDSRCDTEV